MVKLTCNQQPRIAGLAVVILGCMVINAQAGDGGGLDDGSGGGGSGSTMVDPANYVENGKLIRAPYAVKALGEDLFGDKLNLYRGTVRFEQTDVSLPGNSALPMAVTRTLNVGGNSNYGNGLFSHWELAVPHMSGTYASAGWVTKLSNGTTTVARCSNFGAPPNLGGNGLPTIYSIEYWRGIHLNVPGRSSDEVVRRNAGNDNVPADGQATNLVTKGLWAVRCVGSLQRGTGEGFLAIAPDGTQYRFDWMVSRPMGGISKDLGSGGHFSIARHEVQILATLVTDRFGNTVEYRYDASNPWRLNEIVASDGRRLSFTYDGASQRIATASDGVRTWQYAYGAVSGGNLGGQPYLATVTLPDSSTWDFTGMVQISGMQAQNVGLLDLSPTQLSPPPESFPYGVQECDLGMSYTSTIVPVEDEARGTMKHPSGAIGTFVLRPTEHGRNGVPHSVCHSASQYSAGGASPSRMSFNFALIEKTLSGPGMPSQTWRMAYDTYYPGWNDQPSIGDPAKVTVTEPDNVQTVHTFGNTWGVNEGLPLSVEVIENGTVLQRTDTTYSNQFPTPVGTSDQTSGDGIMANRHIPAQQKTITRGGTAFTWQVTTPFDAKARPTAITRSSPAATRAETIEYESDIANPWIVGQIKVVRSGGLEVSRYAYDALGQRTSDTSFGALQHTYGYHGNGRVASISDPAGRTTYFDNYMLGTPQGVRYPTGATASAGVDSIGQIRWVRDAASYLTQYDYDAGGRLSQITPPPGFANTNIYFERVGYDEFGIAGGHWRQTVAKAGARTISYFDARWRPLLTRTFDLANEAATRKVVIKAFDHENQEVYASFPQRADPAYVTDRPAGTYTFHDGLGRELRTEVDSEFGYRLTSSTEYLDGLNVRKTNPRGYATTHGFWALDNPDQTQLLGMSAPEGVSLGIQRDAFSKPTSVTRAGGGTSVTRRYVYDDKQRLCKILDPEVIATVQDYDGAGNLAWRAPGVNLPGTGGCDHASVPGSAKISHGYDELNRLISTSYGDGSPSVARSYWPDGMPKTVDSNGSSWSYTYNGLRRLETETLAFAGQSYGFTHGYDSAGNVTFLRYPDSSSISYFPNALGEPNAVGSYASNVVYHPNGSVASYTLGNGVVHTLTQNTRGLPLVNRDAGVTQDQYSYDANGNVSAIADQQEGVFNRSMGYDGLDRLTSANAPGVWGNASYAYDGVDNLRAAIVGSRVSTLTYDGTNRLASMITNGGTTNYGYDARGNISSKGLQTFGFDIGNRLASASIGGSYLYDGHGRRTRINAPDGSVRTQVYSQGGQMLWATNSGGPLPAGSTAYIYLGGKLIAEKSSSGFVQYVHTDALGSPVAHTNSAGTLLNRARYEAYGYVAQGTKPGPGTSVIGFTGHVQDKETDLVYMQQRYYDPIAGRFLSVDPVTTDAATGKSFGRYHYAANNPYTKVDRDGRDAEHAYIPGGMTRGEYQAANVQAAEHTAVVGVHVAQMVPQLRVAATAIKGVMSLARSTTQPGAAKGDRQRPGLSWGNVYC
jgi:RHS repeat-associated protein